MFSRFQKGALVLLGILMFADVAISAWGALYVPGFTEANILFAGLVHEPLGFIAAIGGAKSLVMAGIILATAWFNRRERAGEPWQGGDIICSTAVTGMAAILIVLVGGNLLLA